jgi:hypothetical protein
MPVHKPYSRVICVRLCEDEYVALQHVCITSGTQNMSSFAREAIQAYLNGFSSKSASCDCMKEFEVQLSNLDRKIDEFFKTIVSSIAELRD